MTNSSSWYQPKPIELGAWELTEAINQKIYAIAPPQEYIDAARQLAQKRKKGSSPPVRSLNPLVVAAWNSTFHTIPNSWRNGGTWLYTTQQPTSEALENLGLLVREWLREEFNPTLGSDYVEDILDRVRDVEWNYTDVPLNINRDTPPDDILYQAIPNYLAKLFEENRQIQFTPDQLPLNFYRVATCERGAELISFPPRATGDSNSRFPRYISFVIQIRLRTLQGRTAPLIYCGLGVRRWLTYPLWREGDESPNRVHRSGVTVYVSNRFRWLDGEEQPLSIIPIKLYRGTETPHLHKALAGLIGSNHLPSAVDIASNSLLGNWEDNPERMITAIAYHSRLGKHPCKPGVSIKDIGTLNAHIAAHLPLRRAGEIVPIPIVKTQRTSPQTREQSNVVMHRPLVATNSLFMSRFPLETILILYLNPQTRDALIAEICTVLKLNQLGVSETETALGIMRTLELKSELGDLFRIKIQTLGGDELVRSLSLPGVDKIPDSRAIEAAKERVEFFKRVLPKPVGRSGAILEIFEPDDYKKDNTDPYKASKIALMQIGYVNQRIHPLGEKTEEEQEADEARVRNAVADLFSQAGVLPQHLIKEDDSVPERMWLTCCVVVRRTSTTTWSGLPSLVIVMVRVNPFSGEVEFTTPTLKQKNKDNKGWVSSWEIYNHLLTENWKPELYEDSGEEDLDLSEETEEEKREQLLLNKFLADCLKNCLTTSIDNKPKPNVLFMIDGQNARSTFKWLQNSNLKCGEFPNVLRRNMQLQDYQKRLHIVRCLTKGSILETPFWNPIGSNPGSRHYGNYAWKNVCDNPNQEIYFGLRETLDTEQGVLKVNQSRLDSGKRPAGNPPLLEYDVVHSSLDTLTLIRFIEKLRDRWAYFSGTTSLPFPFPFAKHARDYAISLKDGDAVTE